MVSPVPRRGEVWICELEPTIGHEIQKARPCLVVSPDELNARVGTVCVMPLTSGSRPAPFRVECRFQGRPGRLVADQLRALDRSRFEKNLGAIDKDTLTAALTVLREMFEA